jgi:hypothetical protein
MIKGIGDKPYLDLDPYLNIPGFIDLNPEICKGLALAREYAKEGTWMTPGFDQSSGSYMWNWKPIFTAFKEYEALPEDHPIKLVGKDIFPSNFKDYKQRNIFTRYLKAAMGANDPYIYYFLWEEGEWDFRNAEKKPTEIQKYFPGLTKWVYDLVDQNIINKIGRVIIFLCDHDGIAFEHRDLDAKNGIFDKNTFSPHKNEFIHIRPRTRRGFYVWDPDSERKYYMNSHASFWNDQDWHGGERSNQQEYGVRIDCVFTDEFRQKLNIQHIESY